MSTDPVEVILTSIQRGFESGVAELYRLKVQDGDAPIEESKG